MRMLSFLMSLFLATLTLASESNDSFCNNSDKFFPFKAAKEAEKSNYKIEAFDMYCQLAFKGDYRAQYQLANFYNSGIDDYVPVDFEFAYLWAKLANSQIPSRKKSLLINELSNKLTSSQLKNADNKFIVFSQRVPTGRRIDQEYKSIDLAKELRLMKKRRKQEYVGSRIKKDKMPEHLKTTFF